MTTEPKPGFWGILEVMGHRRLAGFISEGVFAGEPVINIDVPGDKPGEVKLQQTYGGKALFAVTRTTEEWARAVARTVYLGDFGLQLPAHSSEPDQVEDVVPFETEDHEAEDAEHQGTKLVCGTCGYEGEYESVDAARADEWCFRTIPACGFGEESQPKRDIAYCSTDCYEAAIQTKPDAPKSATVGREEFVQRRG